MSWIGGRFLRLGDVVQIGRYVQLCYGSEVGFFRLRDVIQIGSYAQLCYGSEVGLFCQESWAGRRIAAQRRTQNHFQKWFGFDALAHTESLSEVVWIRRSTAEIDYGRVISGEYALGKDFFFLQRM